ncbi:putative heterokaryon incompatibility protein [Botrytis fragariae]|uniref:Putative heterokaryon incompatibility protein n=1 Tax=Botrytis fragariae TaxID=1964551 RepID=A0A8H6EG22_9HELO|nr:putative heterokaryon incompatibility protein [Botrytis fragariae]KAF5870962.1 putative heterokaryon incompatibility protein [Botrytis fragariae]
MAHALQKETRNHQRTTQSSNQELDSQKLLEAPSISIDLDACNQHNEVASFSEWMSECEACQNIWRCFSQPDSANPVNLGCFTEALATQCRAHKPLVQAFVDHVRSREERDNFLKEELGDLCIIRRGSNSSVRISESISKLFLYWNLLLVRKESVPHHPGTGRILNPDWVDVEMLNRWKKQCLSTHGAECENPWKIWPRRPAFLIDVKTKCLVAGCISGAFVALSYRYGRSPVPKIDAVMLERLQEPYALDALEFEEFLSPVIRHAMFLTSVISERYLWADALCIPHANEKVRAEELNMMGAIYGNAVVTIIAADGDAQDGLRGLEGVSQSRDMNQRIFRFGSEQLIVRNTGIFNLSDGGDYHSRGWTFQEHRLSRRMIIFKNDELHWQCQCSVWHEEMIPDTEIDKFIGPRQKFITAGFPDLYSLGHILSEFNKTELRYDEDALPAISGLLSVLSRTFTGGFLYGIPEMFFERGLGWRSSSEHLNIRRRNFSEYFGKDRPSQAGLPSWSWVGWHGLVDIFGYGEAALISVRINWSEETIPITEWYTSQSSSDLPENRRRITSTWFENRDKYKDFAKPLPSGWSCHDASDTGSGGPYAYPDGCEKYIFKHVDMLDAYRGSWYYPFPVPDIHNSTPPVMPEQTSYLFCKTWRAHLWGRQAGEGNTARIFNSSGEDIDTLQLHNEASLFLFPSIDSEVIHGLPVDLVALYKSRVYSKTWNAGQRKYGHPLQRKDEYKVLWVEWKDGIAYRLASGQVKAEEWERLVPEIIDLILG